MNTHLRMLFQFGWTLTFCPLAIAGSEVRGGGDAVVCEPAPHLNEFSGAYSLDYLLGAMSTSLAAYPLAPVKSVDESIERIVAVLSQKLPLLADSLRDYGSLIRNYRDFTKLRIWLEVPKLADLKDEDLIYEGPDNCKVTPNGAVNLLQVVSRVYDPDTGLIRYYFDQSAVSKLEANGRIQESFLHIHEWLWDFIAKDRINSSRIINWILHSQAIETMPVDDLRKVLRNLGVPERMLTSETRTAPIENQPPEGGEPQRLVGNERFNCALKNHLLVCWGGSIPAGLGRVNALTERPIEIAAGRDHLCVRSQSKIECWGNATAFGSLPQITDAKKIVAAKASTCVVRSNGQIACAGQVKYFLNRTFSMSNSQRHISISDHHICLSGREVATCHGADRSVEYRMLGDDEITAISVTNLFFCLGTSSSTKCYTAGDNRSELSMIDWKSPTTLSLSPTNDLLVCGIVNREAACFKPKASIAVESLPSNLVGEEIQTGHDHACAKSGAQVNCWGTNQWGESEVPAQLQ